MLWYVLDCDIVSAPIQCLLYIYTYLRRSLCMRARAYARVSSLVKQMFIYAE